MWNCLSQRTTTPVPLEEFQYPHYTVWLFEANGMKGIVQDLFWETGSQLKSIVKNIH